MKTLLLLLLTLNLYAQPKAIFRNDLYQQTTTKCGVKDVTISLMGDNIVFTIDEEVFTYKNCIKAITENKEPYYQCMDECGSNYSIELWAGPDGVRISVENHLDGKKNYILSSANICN